MSHPTLPQTTIYSDLEKILHFWDSFKAEKDTIESYGDKWKTLVPLLDQISIYNSVFIMLYDVAGGRIMYAVDKRHVVGYDMSLYLAEDGMKFTHNNAHPAYIDAGLQMEEKAIEYIRQYKDVAEQSKLIISFDFMYKKSDGTYIHILQQSVTIASDDNSNPLLFLSYIRDITYFKKDKTSNLNIITPTETKLWNYNFEKKLLETVQPLSKQEKIVLDCLAKGESSKAIAKELFNSPATIDTHRRNLLKKTNCMDTSGLITYAKLVGLL